MSTGLLNVRVSVSPSLYSESDYAYLTRPSGVNGVVFRVEEVRRVPLRDRPQLFLSELISGVRAYVCDPSEATPVTTGHGHQVLRSKYIEGEYLQRDGWMVAVALPQGYHPYVTWWMDTDGDCRGGHYFKTADEALIDLENR